MGLWRACGTSGVRLGVTETSGRCVDPRQVGSRRATRPHSRCRHLVEIRARSELAVALIELADARDRTDAGFNEVGHHPHRSRRPRPERPHPHRRVTRQCRHRQSLIGHLALDPHPPLPSLGNTPRRTTTPPPNIMDVNDVPRHKCPRYCATEQQGSPYRDTHRTGSGAA
jgi:hypothetical protein